MEDLSQYKLFERESEEKMTEDTKRKLRRRPLAINCNNRKSLYPEFNEKLFFEQISINFGTRNFIEPDYIIVYPKKKKGSADFGDFICYAMKGDVVWVLMGQCKNKAKNELKDVTDVLKQAEKVKNQGFNVVPMLIQIGNDSLYCIPPCVMKDFNEKGFKLTILRCNDLNFDEDQIKMLRSRYTEEELQEKNSARKNEGFCTECRQAYHKLTEFIYI